MNETRFIQELKKSFSESTIFWKLRGSASTAGRPDLLVIDSGKTFFIETKVLATKRNTNINIIKLLTPLQKVNLERIIMAGGNAFLVVLFDGEKSKYAAAIVLHKIINSFSETLPDAIIIELNDISFTIPEKCFMINKNKGRWYGLDYFTKRCL